MRRLNPARLGDERGAVTIVVALLMVAMIGFAAISIDVGRLYAEKRQLQNGADAAAVALACYTGTADKVILAQDLARANENADRARAVVTEPDPGVVQVDTGSQAADGGDTLPLFFAPILGFDRQEVTARSTAACGSPTGGEAALPLAFSICAFDAQTGGGVPSGTTSRVITFPKKDDTGCTGRSGNPVPGGFGWLKTTGGGCLTRTEVGQRVESDTGNNPSTGCSAALVEQARNQTVLLPLYESAGGTGANAWYDIAGYAAFRITGYNFGGQFKWNEPCKGDERCIAGYFVKRVNVGDSFDSSPTAPDFGTRFASLIPNLPDPEEPPL